MVWKIWLLSLSFALVGCATRSGLIEHNDNYSQIGFDKVSKANFVKSGGSGSKFALGLLCLPCMAISNNETEGQENPLDRQCKDAINTQLKAQSPNGNETHKLVMELKYKVLTGFMKEVALQIDWYGVNQKDTIDYHIRTIVAADSALEMFPNPNDAKYVPIFIDLAKKSAEDFYSILTRGKSEYSMPSASYC